MTTHRMTRNANPALIELRERRKDGLGQLLSDVGVHIVAVVVGCLCSVDVEAGASAEVVCVVFAFNVQTAYPP